MTETPPPGSTFQETASQIGEMAASDPYIAHLGALLVSSDPTALQVGLIVEPRHTNFLGLVHGAVVYSVADIALSLISNAEVEAVALDTHLVLSASARVGDRLTATARPATRSRSVATYQVTVERRDGKVVGLFTGTVFHRRQRSAVPAG